MWEQTMLLFALVSCLLLFAAASADAQGSSAGDQAALVNFFNHLKGDQWIRRDGWNSSFTSHCNWFGVLCDVDSRVTSLVLRENGLAGAPGIVTMSALSKLETIYLSGNGLTGVVPFSWLAIPALRVLHLDRNALTEFPSASFASLLQSTSLTNLSLSQNRFWCPIPDYIDDIQFDVDVDTSSCIRTKSETIVYTPTVIVEAPVPTSDIFDRSKTLDRLYVRTTLDINQSSVLQNLTAAFQLILEMNAKDDEERTPLPKAFNTTAVIHNGRNWVLLDFRKDFLSVTTNDQRIDLGLRMKFGHVSVKSLKIIDFFGVYEGEVPVTDPPPLTETPLESVAANKEARTLLILGVAIFVILFLVVVAAYFCRRQTYIKRAPPAKPAAAVPAPGTAANPAQQQQPGLSQQQGQQHQQAATSAQQPLQGPPTVPPLGIQQQGNQHNAQAMPPQQADPHHHQQQKQHHHHHQHHGHQHQQQETPQEITAPDEPRRANSMAVLL